MAKVLAVRSQIVLSVVFASLLLAVEMTWSAAPNQRHSEKPRRARPPAWSRDVLDTFFQNAREVLVGERPDFGSADRGQKSADNAAEATAHPGAETGRFRWSALVSAETIEDEVKRTHRRLAEHLKTPSAFKGGGYTECRRHFSKLAVLFAVAAQYDLDARWKSNAAGLRDLFAKAGFHCKVGSDGTYQEARLRLQDLGELIRGGPVETPNAEPEAVWTAVADRPSLMESMELLYDERLDPLLANATEFRKNGDEALHEAEMLALLAQLIASKDYEFSDDEEFVAYCHLLRDAATAIVEAVQLKNYDQARQAIGRAANACSECHEGYRS